MAAATRGVSVAAVWAVFHGQSVEASVISALLATVDQVVVVDNRVNASIPLQGMNELHGLSRYGNVKLLFNHNAGGLAGAYNRAVEWLGVAHPELDCVVFLDEDSEVAALQPFLQDDAVRELLAATSTAAVAPVPKDLATGLRSKRMQFVNPWRLRYLPRHCTRLQPVAFVINSMSVWRMQALRQLGPHDEGLAIDHVDTDYCLRARRAGLQVYCHGKYSFGHRIGQRQRFSFMGVQMQAGGHAPNRRHMIGRNTMWLARRSLLHEPGFTVLCILRLAYEAVGILAAEDRRGGKLWALLRGAVSGLWAR
jgi:rhamnosyltransferase